MKRLAVGLLAHVDAGKTTLSESLLYKSGTIRHLGRVDNRDAFLDTDEQERARGITIFSKQAVMEYGDAVITLLDTPGHVDFSAEMERTLWVMDYAILVISGADGIQGHTLTLWRLLERYRIPVFFFINKMDQPGTEKEKLLRDIQKEFGRGCIDFGNADKADFDEQLAVCDDNLTERYLEGQDIREEDIRKLIAGRKVFPCYFGSALKLEGIDEFMQGIIKYMAEKEERTEFGARVFKITRDSQGNRLTHMKITGGKLTVKDSLPECEEKVNQIRIYSGERFETLQQGGQGTVCAVTGLGKTYPGQGLGAEQSADIPVLEPVLTFGVELPEETDAAKMLPLLRELEEEEPALHVLWQEETGTIQIKLMGEVQIEVLKKLIADRYQVEVNFGAGKIVYKETIADTVEGVGHFEPLRHYAEVHLLMEPGEEGSGMQFLTDCSEDVLDWNWQKLILTHLEEREHVGVLTGSAITDMRITLVSGRAHTKHTEGGDFRQATYRAVRQGLMQAKGVLLEPWYNFRLEIPGEMIGRAMTDIENMHGKFAPPVLEGDRGILTGCAPVVTMRDYQITVNAYTRGRGNLMCTLKGYAPCHNEEEVLESISYQPEEDTDNPSSSVFCAHGAGFIVPWYQVKDYMHVENRDLSESGDKLVEEERMEREAEAAKKHRESRGGFSYSIDEEQIVAILNRTFHANEKAAKHAVRKKKSVTVYNDKGRKKPVPQKRYLIVDGYNIVHAWKELKELAVDNLEGARMKLLDILCNYQAVAGGELIVVFDAYKVKGNLGEMFDYQNIHVVYTKEAETADTYIEKLTHRISGDYLVTVATSDGLIQLITRGQNCAVLSARELEEEVERINEALREYMEEDKPL
ncbi:MAG: TetM/TetW/TetO/TetS family tetracycline resistance ribosomal protection protein [Bacteroidales bacterium]|nr:TetM/TetW/TetO/TetS family tetracycline resistance ribosomal protection protein [Clostridium sp.]MCM1202843.1 TetM/TetW/TetO/TetS family tetracycline resistance ribosomal protection protein [Bacteroidales bacterium]